MGDKHATECILADAAGIARAGEVLLGGGLVAIPTETVYGLAARADCDEAVARIFEAKGRPTFNPLIVHIASIDQLADFTPTDRRVADWYPPHGEATLTAFAQSVWPGPVTLVVPKRPRAPIASQVTAGLETIALRMPRHHVARELLGLTGPLAAPSANRSGFISPTSAEHVLASLDGKIDLVLDGGPTSEGIESTILKLRDDGRWEELRPGPEDTGLWHSSWFSADERGSASPIEAPGQLARHYAPDKPLRLAAEAASDEEFLIGFGAIAGDVTLSPSGDLEEAARRLYACLHAAAASDKPRIAVAPVPDTGIGAAINDRLRRAAA